MKPEFQSPASCLQVKTYRFEKPQLDKNKTEKAHLQHY